MDKNEVREVMEVLFRLHPDAQCELNHRNPFELLVATVLSAQTTDVSVNKVTPALFEAYPTPEKMAAADVKDVENLIRSIGLYKNKAKNLVLLSRRVLHDFGGIIPREINQLTTLEGVGKKTANVVVSNAFGVPAFAVDTHVFRVSNRIGFVRCKDVACTERNLMKKIKREDWIRAHHTLIFHGRYICKSRKPLCETCSINAHCKYFLSEKKT